MKEISVREAIRKASEDLMVEDRSVIILGTDIGIYGGRFGTTKGLLDKFGSMRVIDLPLVEDMCVGMGIGAAHAGLKPIVEVLYSDFLTICLDDIVRASRWQSLCGRKLPLVIRSAFGGYANRGPELSSAKVSHLLLPNVIVLSPSTPSDAYWDLRTAFLEETPTIVLEHKAMYGYTNSLASEKPSPFEIQMVKQGKDALIISYSFLLLKCLEAAEKLQNEYGISAGVLNINRIWPLDYRTIFEEARRFKNIILVEECLQEEGIMIYIEDYLFKNSPEVNIKKIFRKADIVPFGQEEIDVLPQTDDIVRKAVEFEKFNRSISFPQS